MTDYLNSETAEALLKQALDSDESDESDSGPLAAGPRTPKPYEGNSAAAPLESNRADESETSTPKNTDLK